VLAFVNNNAANFGSNWRRATGTASPLLSRLTSVRDLLLRAKHLFVAAIDGWLRRPACLRRRTNTPRLFCSARHNVDEAQHCVRADKVADPLDQKISPIKLRKTKSRVRIEALATRQRMNKRGIAEI
jgi:hypothetical protein